MVSKMSSLAQKRVVVPVSSVGSPFSSGPVGHAHLEGLEPVEAVALDLDLDALGERVDHRDADAVQAAGDLVAAAAELAAGVQHGQHDGDGGQLLARRDVDGDAAAVVGDLDGAVGQDRDLDPVAEAGQRLVDGVVHDLPHQVVQAALAGGADVHAGPLADRLEALEDLDRAGVVVARLDRVALEDAGGDHVGGSGARPGSSAACLRRRRQRSGLRKGTLRRWSRRPRKASSSAVRPDAGPEQSSGDVQCNTMAASRVGRRPRLSLPVSAPTITCAPRICGDPARKCPSEARNRPGQPVSRGSAYSPYGRGGVQGSCGRPGRAQP